MYVLLILWMMKIWSYNHSTQLHRLVVQHSYWPLKKVMLKWFVYWLRLMQKFIHMTRYSILTNQLCDESALFWLPIPQDGRSALHKASQGGHVDVVRVLIETSAHINQQTKVVDPCTTCVLLSSILILFYLLYLLPATFPSSLWLGWELQLLWQWPDINLL